MPSSRSSLDKRDIYYRLHKSAGYRARSAYKLIHLDEEFDLFGGVETVVDLCAAPGSWSQVVGERLGTQMAAGTAKLVSLDLQPMAPLRHTTTLQADLTTPCTIPLVLTHLDNKKADLVICDGAPDVTGVHDLDAYLHHQLLMAAFTLTLAILAKGGTAVYKVFLSPLDPKGERLREGMKVFFRAEEDQGEWFEEYDDENENPRAGQDGMGRRGGVWVRKPRSSRKGSGEAFLVCRNYDPSTVPLPLKFSDHALQALSNQTTGTLNLDSLAHLAGEDVQLSPEQARRWEVLKAWAGKGDLNPMTSLSEDAPSPPARKRSLEIDTTAPTSHTPLTPSSPTITRTEATPGTSNPTRPPIPLSLVLPSSSSFHLIPPRPIVPPTKSTGWTRGHHSNRSIDSDIASPTSPPTLPPGWDRLGPTPLPSPIHPHPPGGESGILNLRQEYPIPPREPYALSRYVAPDLFADQVYGRPRADTDGAISPALSTSSKTDMFFGSGASASGSDALPAPPKPLAGSAGSLGRAGSIGRGWPAGRRPSLLSGERERERAVTMPTTPVYSIGAPPGPLPADTWGLPPPRTLEVTSASAPTGSRSIGLGSNSGSGGRDRRLSGAGRVMSIAQSQGFGQSAGHGRERTDSINSTVERVMASPLAGLPSGDSIRGLAEAAIDTPAKQGLRVPVDSAGRRECQIEREEHRTAGDEEDVLSQDQILEPTDGLDGIEEDVEMQDEEGVSVAPFGNRSREDVLGSFSGALPAFTMSRRENGEGRLKRKWKLEKKLGDGAFSAVWAAKAIEGNDPAEPTNNSSPPLTAAIKLLPRRLTTANDRTRISFLREVGVLSRLTHPCIVSFIDNFETKGYYCLALEQVDGGELFEVVQSIEWHRLVSQSGDVDAGSVPPPAGSAAEGSGGGEVVIRRIFSELARATGFLHACGVVHRDIKLENILLTSNVIRSLPSSLSPSDMLAALPPNSQPLIKLTDFGLSRFISPSSPHLTTRCGSESFAAPEIIMGKPYDGRDTDSWACGVVLYAMLTGELPFDSPLHAQVDTSEEGEKEERRKRMLRIAKGAYRWPKDGMGSRCSEGVRSVVRRLLVRDPRKRARVDEVWDEEWMKGHGSVGSLSDSKSGIEDTEVDEEEKGRKKRVLDGWLIVGETSTEEAD